MSFGFRSIDKGLRIVPTISIPTGLVLGDMYVYNNKFYFFDGTIASAFVTEATQNTLINKTFDDPITMKQVATPIAPAANYDKIYFKADNKLYKIDRAGHEKEVGGAALFEISTYSAPLVIVSTPTITIPSNQRCIVYVQGTGMDEVVTGLAVGSLSEQELFIVGTSNDLTVKFPSNSVNMQLNGEAVLADNFMLSLVWNGTLWIEVSRSF